MTDNTTLNPGSGGDVIATDDLTTLNGGAVSGIKAQRVKAGFGPDSSFTDVAPSTPLPTYNALEDKATFRGRAATFRTVGRAGTTPRRILAIWNALGSGKVVHVNQITLDVVQTAVMAVTVVPPIIRIYRITAIPTNGTALSKIAKDSNLSSSASISLFGDASADGTNSASALAATTTSGAMLAQEFMARLITAAGYEMFDRVELLAGWDIVLRPGEGLVLSLDLTLATQEPSTTTTVAGIDWFEV
jgi:hypothetical protein